jgi:hypothetical protein
MIVDAFLRSYAGDVQWVPWALRSLDKFVTGIRDIVVVVPANDYTAFKSLNLTKEIICSSRLEPFKDDYCGQQADKLIAHLYTDAEHILYWDSDVLAIRPFCPKDLMIEGKPRCLETPFEKLVNADGSPAVPWKPIVERALGHPVSKERMRAHPFLVNRMALIGLRDYMQKLHHVPLVDYIAAQPNGEFSEWNVLHSWAADHAPDLFTFWDTEKQGVPEPFVRQFWSWSGVTLEIRAEMEKLIA